MPTISDPPSVCATQQDLLKREERLRSEAKIEPEHRQAALLANSALQVQKERYQHEESCQVCRRIERRPIAGRER